MEDVKTADEMPIVEWLRRLNMDKYASQFVKQRIYFVSDLTFFKYEGEMYGAFNVDRESGDAKRMANMVQGEAGVKEDFKLMTQNTARQAIRRFVPNPKLCEELVACIPEESLSGF